MTDDAYNDGYTHEVLHTAHVLADTWDRHIVETRCAEEFPDVKAAAEKAANAMYYLYQLVGQKFADDEAFAVLGPNAKITPPAQNDVDIKPLPTEK